MIFFSAHETPLHLAAEKNKLDVVKYLLSVDGINKEIKNKIFYINFTMFIFNYFDGLFLFILLKNTR